MYLAKNPGPVAAWAPAEYPLPTSCNKIILDREMFFIANLVGNNADQGDFTFRYQEQELWRGLGTTVVSRKQVVTTENSFGANGYPPTSGVLWYQVRCRSFGGADGKDIITQWLLMRPTPEGWKIFQRPEEVEDRGGPVAQRSRVKN